MGFSLHDCSGLDQSRRLRLGCSVHVAVNTVMPSLYFSRLESRGCCRLHARHVCVCTSAADCCQNMLSALAHYNFQSLTILNCQYSRQHLPTLYSQSAREHVSNRIKVTAYADLTNSCYETPQIAHIGILQLLGLHDFTCLLGHLWPST